jgi:hypothetical protein
LIFGYVPVGEGFTPSRFSEINRFVFVDWTEFT